MSLKYDVEILELREIHELPGAWDNNHFRKLLELIDYEDAPSISDDELKEMTALALSDLTLDQAIIAVLELRLGERLTKGQRLDLLPDMQEGRIWEEYGDMAFHEELFNAACMLYWAFGKNIPEPDSVRIKLNIIAANEQSASNLKKPTAAFIARLLNDGMNDHNAIHRLFHDEITAGKFSDAEHIIWNFEASEFNDAERSTELIIHSSWNWVDELKGVEQYVSSAHNGG